MEDTPTERFKIGNDDSISKTVRSTASDTRVKRLGRRITLLAILLPLLVVALLFMGYLDVIKRVGILENAGKTEVRSLSKDLDVRLSELSVQYTAMQDTIQKKIVEAEKSIAALQESIQKSEDRLASLNKAKTDKKELKNALAGTKKEIRQTKAALKKMDEDLKKSMEEFSASVQASIDKLSVDIKIAEAGIAEDVASKISMETLQLEFFKEQKKNQRRIDSVEGKWQEKFLFLEEKINERSKAAPAARSSGTISEQEIQ